MTKRKGESMKAEVVIDGVEYVRKDSQVPSPIRIVILQRGWVKVGRFYQDGSNCRLEDCSAIRLWGTTRGLGEIAEGGPTEKTILEHEPTCRFHEMTIIATLDCVEAKWAKHLSS